MSPALHREAPRVDRDMGGLQSFPQSAEAQRGGDRFGCECLTPRRDLSNQPDAVSMDAAGHGRGDRVCRHPHGRPSVAGARAMRAPAVGIPTAHEGRSFSIRGAPTVRRSFRKKIATESTSVAEGREPLVDTKLRSEVLNILRRQAF